MLLVGIQNITASLEKSLATYYKVKYTLITYDLATPLLRIYPREQKTYVHAKICACVSVAILFILFKTENNPNTNQLWYIHTMEYY